MPTPTSPSSLPLHKRAGLSLDRLHTLVAVDEAGSLIAAAKGNTSRATQFSRQLRELEGCFGTRLITTAGKTVKLTNDGAALARGAREFYQQLNDFAATHEGGNRTFTFGAGESLLQWIVVPALAVLDRRLPDIAFKLRNLQNAEIIRGLEELSLDFGLVRKESVRKPLESQSLGRVNYTLCVPRHLARDLKKRDLKSLFQKLPLAVHLESTYVQGELESALKGMGITPNIRLRCDSFPNAYAALRSGAYATLMIRFPGTAPVPEGVDVLPLPFLDHTSREIHLVWNPRLCEVRTDAAALVRELARSLAWQDE